MSREMSYLSLEKRLWMGYTWEWISCEQTRERLSLFLLISSDLAKHMSPEEKRLGTFQNNEVPTRERGPQNPWFSR